jgi:addiction module RelB/DinJ family antitoxin
MNRKTALFITVRLDAQLKQEAEHIFAQLGFTTGDAITVLLSQVVLRGGLPFDVTADGALPQSGATGGSNYHDAHAARRAGPVTAPATSARPV